MQAVLRLRDARELFEQPASTPLDDDYEPWCVQPGAEYLTQVVRVLRRRRGAYRRLAARDLEIRTVRGVDAVGSGQDA